MRKIKEILRLKHECGLSKRKIATSCAISRSVVADYLLRAETAGFTWPLPEGFDDARLEALLFPSRENLVRGRPLPDWLEVHRELKRKNVTLALLWQEYKERHPEGYQYSWFAHEYRSWAGRLDLVMRQDHRAGEKLFVDYAGQTMPIVSSLSGEITAAQIFTAVLGASSYTYAEATMSQSLPDWIGSHVRAFSFFKGVTEVVIPDNLKSGVAKPCFYEPDIQQSYQEMAAHYGTVILPARVRKPRDKAKAEVGVQVVQRWICARLRNHTFFSLADLNREIGKLLDILNNKAFKKLPGSRRSMFEGLERPALKPLPATPYEYAEWKKATVHIDYHVEVTGHYYSVPYQLVGRKIDIRFTATIVECLHRSVRVASHKRSYEKGRHTTVAEHMPPQHQKYLRWSPERFLRWAGKIGPQTVLLAERLFAPRPHPQQAYRSLLGILRLGQSYTDARLEAACRRALEIGAISFRSIESILKNGLENRPVAGSPAGLEPCLPIQHGNIRGPQYYQSQEEARHACASDH